MKIYPNLFDMRQIKKPEIPIHLHSDKISNEIRLKELFNKNNESVN